MNDREGQPPGEPWFTPPNLRIALIALGAALAGGLVSRAALPSSSPATRQAPRPIVQIVRPQAGLPDLSDLIARQCPSIAAIVPRGGSASPGAGGALPSAFAISADGWLLTMGPLPSDGAQDVLFSDGRRAPVGEIRTDPVSGLTIFKVDEAPLQPLPLSDQTFPRVGQFGFSLMSPAANGCSASAAMISSDFLADGGGPLSYVRVSPRPDSWGVGMPFFGTDGRVVGISTNDSDSSIIPGPLVALVVDELIRNSPAASTKFGFRAVDFAPPLSARLGSVRSEAGVAFIEAHSPASSLLKAGDIVTGVNDEPVSSASELNRALDALTGDATLTIIRGSQQLTVTVKQS